MSKKVVVLITLLAISLLAMPLAGCAKPLTLSVWAPLDGASFTSSPIVVRGNVSDAKAQVTVNGVTVSLSKQGDFHTTIEPLEGDNTISIVATRGDETIIRSVIVTYNPVRTLAVNSTLGAWHHH